MRSSNYDINNTCNLNCEGCYYFVSDQKTTNKRPSSAQYDEFFAAEAARGVNYPVFSGGEPSLNPAALLSAGRIWSSGIIYTNGAKPVPPSVPFRVAISVWGSRARNTRLRGRDSYDQAMNTAQGDPRALIYFTLTRENIDDIKDVVADCVSRDLKISFNDFSMTTEYIRLLENSSPGASPYFRLSSKEDNLSLRMEDRRRAADIIDELLDDHPDNVVFCRELNDWMHRAEQIHSIDPVTRVATDCTMLNTGWHLSYGFDLKPLSGKRCGAPEFDCSDCRAGPVATFTLLTRLSEQMRRSPEARARYLSLRELMMRFHYWNWNGAGLDAPVVAAEAAPRAA